MRWLAQYLAKYKGLTIHFWLKNIPKFSGMTQAYLVLIAFLCGCVPNDAPSPDQAERFIKVYGGANDELATDLLVNSNEGYFILGTTFSTDDPANRTLQGDPYVVKTDLYGAAQWSRRFDWHNRDDLGHAITSLDDGYVLLASAADTVLGNRRLWVFSLDDDGGSRQLIDFQFGVAAYDFTGAAISPSNNHLIVLGTTTWVDTAKAKPLGGFVADTTDIFLAEFSQEGDTIWSRRLGFEGEDQGKKLLVLPTGRLAILAQTDFGADPEAEGLGTYITLTNAYGIPTHTRRMPKVVPGDLQATPDGGYVLIGTSYRTGDSLMYVARLGAGLDLIWEKTYPGMGLAYGQALAIKTGDGGSLQYLLAGHTRQTRAEDSDLFLSLIDEAGTEIWANDGKGIRTYGGPQNEVGVAVAVTADGGYALLSQQRFGESFIMSLLKVNGEGRLDP